MQTADNPSNYPDLEQFQSVVDHLGTLSGEVEQLQSTVEDSLDRLAKLVGQQSLEIQTLQQAMPEPRPILDDEALADQEPPATQALEKPKPPQTKQTKQEEPNDSAKPKQPSDLQLLTQRLSAVELALREMPPQIERGVTATLFSTRTNPKSMLYIALGAAFFHCLFTVGCVVGFLHGFPAPLNRVNEAQLYKIYQKIR